jgi:broad specificity phosphatase PhoE
VHPGLRERYFGDALELTSHDGYCPAWEADAADPASQPGGDGESVADVAQRLQQLMEVGTTAAWLLLLLISSIHLQHTAPVGAQQLHT